MRPSSPLSVMAVVVVGVLTVLLWLSPQATGLMPYTRTSLWDMMMLPAEDPFRILEQSPLTLTIPKGVEPPLALALARADWKETPRAHVISLDVPGVKREDIKIEVEENRVLRISGERKAEADEKWHRAERTAGKFWRQFRLPASADVEAVEARLEGGVLRVTVPKLADEKKRQPRVVSIAEAGDGKGQDIQATKAEM